MTYVKWFLAFSVPFLGALVAQNVFDPKTQAILISISAGLSAWAAMGTNKAIDKTTEKK